MNKHFAWRPHLDRDRLFNPFVPSERTPKSGHVELSEAYGDEVPEAQEPAPSADNPSDENKEAAS